MAILEYSIRWCNPNSRVLPSGYSECLDTESGDSFGLTNEVGKHLSLLRINENYVIGSVINGTTTVTGESFASLDLTVSESYTWNWSRANRDPLTFYVAGTPKPSSLTIHGCSAIGRVFCRRR